MNAIILHLMNLVYIVFFARECNEHLHFGASVFRSQLRFIRAKHPVVMRSKEWIFMHFDASIKMEKLFASKSLQMCLFPVVVFCFSADSAAFVVTCSGKRTDFLARKKIKTIDVNVFSLGMRTK